MVKDCLDQIGYVGKIAAVAYFEEDIKILREAGVDTAFNVFSEAGAGLAAHSCEVLGPFK
jgi:hypothetical protein